MINRKQKLQRNALASSLAMILSVSFASAVSAQDAEKKNEETPAPTTAKKIDAVQVVGSRIKRSEIEGPSPVTIITSEQMEREGFTTVHDALVTLSQNTGFAQNDFNAAGGFTPNQSVINLRNLGPGRTLLLINGRRVNDYPFPYNGRSNAQNYNSIPAAAVDRIEILAGGASAIYGSDAVAGVINVVLKQTYDGHNLKVVGQTSAEGGREVFDAQFVGGNSGDNWNLIYTLEALKADELFAYQMHQFDSAEDNNTFPGVGGQAGVGGYQPPTGIQLRRVSRTGTTLSYSIPLGFDCSASSSYRPWTYSSSATGAVFGPACGYDKSVSTQSIANGNKDFNAYIMGDYTLEGGAQIWGSFTAFKSHSELSGGTEFWQNGPQPGAAIYDPTLGYRVIATRVFTPEAYGGSGGTNQIFDEKSWEFAAGIRGDFGTKFDWDATISHAEYQANRSRPRMTVDGAAAYFLGPRLGTVGVGPYNTAPILAAASAGTAVYNVNLAHLYGVITQADYEAMSTRVLYDGHSESSTVSFTVNGDLFDLPAGPVGFAAVVEASKQSYKLVTDSRLAPSVRAIYNLTGTGGGGDRSRMAAGFELSVPVLESLTLDLAARYDKYDDITNVDDAITWATGLEWRPFDNLLVRGNYSTSFKAPDMHYVFSEPSGSFITTTDFARCSRDGISAATCSGAGANYNYSVFTTSQGNPGLAEETAKSFTAGVVWDILEDLTFTADYYNIELQNEVSVLLGTTIVGDEYGCATGFYTNGAVFPYASSSAYCLNIATLLTRDPANDGRLTEVRSGPVNIAFRAISGIDANLAYKWTTERHGKFYTNVAWSHVLDNTLQSRAGDPVQALRDSNASSDYRSRVRATLGWEKNDWDATLFMNRVGSFPIWSPSNSNVVNGTLGARTQPYITYNTSVGYRFNEDFSMRLAINNLLDNTGDFDPTFNSYPYTWQGYDLIGRTYSLQVSYDF